MMRIYSALLRFYPDEHYRRFSSEMRGVHQEAAAAARARGRAAAVRFSVTEVSGLALEVALVRFRAVPIAAVGGGLFGALILQGLFFAGTSRVISGSKKEVTTSPEIAMAIYALVALLFVAPVTLAFSLRFLSAIDEENAPCLRSDPSRNSFAAWWR